MRYIPVIELTKAGSYSVTLFVPFLSLIASEKMPIRDMPETKNICLLLYVFPKVSSVNLSTLHAQKQD